MWQIQTSDLFERQLVEFAQNYRDRASLEVAEKFLDCVEDALNFIEQSPFKCAVYYELQEIAGLEDYEFRKWRVKTFPFSVFFRIQGEHIILMEAIYAHKMDILNRLPSDFDLKSQT